MRRSADLLRSLPDGCTAELKGDGCGLIIRHPELMDNLRVILRVLRTQHYSPLVESELKMTKKGPELVLT